MKKIAFILSFLFAFILSSQAQQAKYVFYFIGDGMGVYQTKLFEYMKNDCEFGDGEDIFYGYLLPYMGYSRTDSLSGTTDSAAGGTALACGTKTYNKYLGLDGNKNEIKSLTELASELKIVLNLLRPNLLNKIRYCHNVVPFFC